MKASYGRQIFVWSCLQLGRFLDSFEKFRPSEISTIDELHKLVSLDLGENFDRMLNLAEDSKTIKLVAYSS